MTFLEEINQTREAFNAALKEAITLGGVFARLSESMRYALTGGKRLRPILLLKTNALYGKCDSAMDFAVAIEMIHNYSLVHDDLPSMDNDVLRHGAPSCHAKFGEADALLCGDALLNLAFEKMLAAVKGKRELSAARYIARASGAYGMCGGQSADLFYTKNRGDIEALRYIDERKTGALLSASIVAGAILGGAKKSEIALLERFSAELGVLFQITDDLLDELSDAKTLGKSTGKDKENGKFTFVTELSVEGAKREARARKEKCDQYISELSADKEFFFGLTEYLINRKS